MTDEQPEGCAAREFPHRAVGTERCGREADHLIHEELGSRFGTHRYVPPIEDAPTYTEVARGTAWRHVENGNLYRVLDQVVVMPGRHPGVSYAPLDPDHEVYVRTLANFVERFECVLGDAHNERLSP